MSDTAFVSHCLELLAPLGSTSSRRMFGGHALYIDGLCMALIIQDTLYLKVDDASRAVFERAGCRPFTYAGKHDEVHVMSYYTAPEEAMESPAEMMPWARRGLAAAVSARAKAPPARKKAAPAKKAPARKAPAKKTAGKSAPARPASAKVPANKTAARKAAKS
jgi:DNA transformation protein and related proteins